MGRNMGAVDRLIRVVIALGIFSTYFVFDGKLRFIALVGFVPLFTALIARCPAYGCFGIKTCSISKR